MEFEAECEKHGKKCCHAQEILVREKIQDDNSCIFFKVNTF